MKHLILLAVALMLAGCAPSIPASELPTAAARERAWRQGAVTEQEKEESKYQCKQAELLSTEANELAQRFQHPEKFPESKKWFSTASDDPVNVRPVKENALLRMREGGFLIYGQPNIPPKPEDTAGQNIHHAIFGLKLKEQMDKLGIDNNAGLVRYAVSHQLIE